MTRLSAAFDRARAEHRAALVTFVTAGDPTPAATASILDALVEGGADVIELGMPFTDPMADGPAIQAANLRSLGKGTTTREVLLIADEFRERHPDIPLVLMGYANPMVRRGADWFAGECKGCGIDGVICVDIPPEEDQELGPALRAAGVDLIRLATPTTDAARLPAVLDGSSGFLYYVARIKRSTGLPVAVGFGVRTPEQAAAIARVADGVVVGSALVELVAIHGEDAPEHLRQLTSALAAAVHSAERQAA